MGKLSQMAIHSAGQNLNRVRSRCHLGKKWNQCSPRSSRDVGKKISTARYYISPRVRLEEGVHQSAKHIFSWRAHQSTTKTTSGSGSQSTTRGNDLVAYHRNGMLPCRSRSGVTGWAHLRCARSTRLRIFASTLCHQCCKMDSQLVRAQSHCPRRYHHHKNRLDDVKPAAN